MIMPVTCRDKPLSRHEKCHGLSRLNDYAGSSVTAGVTALNLRPRDAQPLCNSGTRHGKTATR